MSLNPLYFAALARLRFAVPALVCVALLPAPAHAKAQKCKIEKVEKSAGAKTSDPKKDKEQTCKKKKAKFIEDEKAEEQCQKKPKPSEACCCADPEGGEQQQSGGGGAPQMPQQSPQQSSQDQGQPSSSGETGATSPTPDSNNVASTSAPKSEDSKTGEDGKGQGKAGGTIGFGIVDPSKVTASMAPPAGAPAASTFPGAAGAGSGSSSPFPSSGSAAGAGGHSSSGGGSGGGGGGGGGASLPGKSDGAEAAAGKGGAENPYELSLGGGKLGAPKGFAKGSEADSAVAAAAADSFSKDFSPAAPAAGATAEAEDESGLTLFKMVNFRMREVKKRGGI